MAVDQHGRLYSNRAFLESISLNECATVLLHEVLHVVGKHHMQAKRVILIFTFRMDQDSG